MGKKHEYYKEIKIGEKEAIVDLARGIYNWQVSVLHIDSGVGASFPAFITDYSETYQSDWNEDTYFGRNDKVGRHAGTSRTINLSLELPAYSVADARSNMHQVEHLVATMYPSYTSAGNDGVLQSYPLVKVKFANLIRNSNRENSYTPLESGLAGWIPNLTINPVLESGFHSVATTTKGDEFDRLYSEQRGGGVLMPKVWQLSFSLRVVHEHKLGWHSRRWIPKSGRFPFGIDKGFTETNRDYGTAVIDAEQVKQIRQKELDRILSRSPLDSDINAGNRYGVRGGGTGGIQPTTEATPTVEETGIYEEN